MSYAEAAQKAKEFHETLKDNAENNILQKFPERIIHLNELLKQLESYTVEKDTKYILNIPLTMKTKDNVDNSEGETPTLDSSSQDIILKPIIVPSNENLIEIFKILKPCIKQLVEDTNALKVWLSLLIPRIEDGNNFGVSVQGNILEMIQTHEVNAGEFLEQIFIYHRARGKLIKNVAEHPLIEDYRRAVVELDEFQYLQTSIIMHAIRNCYSLLHDMIVKNLDKIKTPRSSNVDLMY